MTKSIEGIGGFKGLSENLDKNASLLNGLKYTTEQLAKDLKEDRRKYEQGEPDREQIVFSILNRAGLSYIIPGLISISGESLSYWKTGLHLMHSYLQNQKNAPKFIQALVQLSKEDSIAPSSKGFLLYLAGKLQRMKAMSPVVIS